MRLSYLVAALLAVIGIAGYYAAGGAGTADIANYPPKNATIVAFGDSLVEGYGATEGNDLVSDLSKELGRPVLNLGRSGDTTEDGLARIGDALAADPGVVILLLGGNDFIRQTDSATTEANLGAIIERLESNGAVVVLLGVRSGVLGGDSAAMYEELAARYRTVYVPDVLSGVIGHGDLMYDGVHPNDAGYAMIAKRVAAAFRKYAL
ncbi:MAG TPA: GDSL-type esterase/lipase family protein [Candidatus Paceibacterota bacterium]|nr:GDSL-type esterase/lipase family protein [Candidatus Paceibacterota bacterium]